MSELLQMSAMGGSFAAPDGVAMGRNNVVDDPAERATGPRPDLIPGVLRSEPEREVTVPPSGGK
jgi:hypothetical protein